MGNRTYTNGILLISPGLTEEHYKTMIKFCDATFGLRSAWKLTKPRWSPAHLRTTSEGDWEKIDDWQDQLQLLVTELKELDYDIEGTIEWEDETHKAVLHVQTHRLINCHYVEIIAEPDWDDPSGNQYPAIPDEHKL